VNVVIGSGLAAVGAIRALLKRGIRPVVLDIGDRLPEDTMRVRRAMSHRSPSEWTDDEWKRLGENETATTRGVPRKLVFGSDYFYSAEQVDGTKSEFITGSPPWSPARGGFSVGWGAAVLPPSASDIASWPFSHDELLAHMRLVLDGVPVSEPDDELAAEFGRIRPENREHLALSRGQRQLLERLQQVRMQSESAQVLVGQSRLLTRADARDSAQCRMCGHCSSGCVYESIYTAEQEFDRWTNEGSIDYRSGAVVFRLHENGGVVRIHYEAAGRLEILEAERVFVAAGAVNSTRLLLNSSPDKLESAIIRRTGYMVQMYASPSPLAVDWPNVNTQASHFVALRHRETAPYWAHVQIGQPNELILKRLGLRQANLTTLVGRTSKALASRLVSATLNVHSDCGPTYEVRIARDDRRLPSMMTRQQWDDDSRTTVNSYAKVLASVLRGAGLYHVPCFRSVSESALTYHFGASFPMASQPTDANHTDTLGRPFGWQRIHAVDTSVLPAIPATTVGLLTMANAHRIAANAP
jgi:hypothetical protein